MLKLNELYKNDINRPIQNVIKISDDQKLIKQELEEYVLTKELISHFNTFFSSYNKSINNATDEIGVWISGFYGSGKSHLLKIISYLLDSTLRVAGKYELILSVKYDSILKNVDNNISDIESVFNDIMNSNYKLVFVNDSDWDKLKNEYIKKTRNGIVYSYIEEDAKVDDNEVSYCDTMNNNSEVLATSLFGDDIVELK